MRPRVLRRRLILAGLGGMLAAATITTGIARAACEVVTVTTTYVPQRDWDCYLRIGVSTVLAAAVTALLVYLCVSLLRRSR